MPSAAKSRPSTPRTMRLSEAGLTEILSVLHGGFCPPLEVHDKIAGEASIARPFGVGRICAVADEVTVVAGWFIGLHTSLLRFA